MQNGKQDKLISSYQAEKMLGIGRNTLITLPLPHLEIQRRDRVLRRYSESVIKAFKQENTVNAGT